MESKGFQGYGIHWDISSLRTLESESIVSVGLGNVKREYPKMGLDGFFAIMEKFHLATSWGHFSSAV